MFHLALKSIATILIPRVATDLYERFFSEAIPKPPAVITYRKPADTTQITQRMFDYIKSSHTAWQGSSEIPANRKLDGFAVPAQADFVHYMNLRLGTNKSPSTLGKVFNGHTLRSSLPLGSKLVLHPVIQEQHETSK